MRRAALLPLLSIASLALLAADWAGTVPAPAPLKPGLAAITVEDAKKHLGFLAGPETLGRGSGQPGYQKAAEYVAARFKEYGIEPGGENGTYFQNGSLYRSHIDSGSLQVGSKTISLGPDLSLGEIYGDANLKGQVVLIRVKDKKMDLPSGTDLTGAIVLLSGPGVDASIRIDIRMSNPAAILNIRSDVPKVATSVRQTKPERWNVQGTLSEKGATALASAAGYSGQVSGIGGMTRPVEVHRLGQGWLQAKVTAGEVKVPNVVGIIRGTDPNLKSEVVGLGAHLDHLGTDGETTYWGADDDGSGSTALIQVAKAFGTGSVKPKRSIIFLAFYGEEMGLLGSQHYARNPVFPIDQMVAHLQMDMVGRDSYGPQNGDPNRMDKVEENRDTMRLVGSKRISTQLHNAVLDANKHVGFRFLYDGEDVYERSDHYVFASRGVPVAFLFDGFTPDYHQPTDTIDKINWTKLTNAAKLFYITAVDLANRPNRPVRDVR